MTSMDGLTYEYALRTVITTANVRYEHMYSVQTQSKYGRISAPPMAAVVV